MGCLALDLGRADGLTDMATRQNLIGLGLPVPLANRMCDASDGLIQITAQGATQASAYQLSTGQNAVLITATSGGAGVNLPVIGTDQGAMMGDNVIITNALSASVIVYASGANTTITQLGASISAATGVSVSSYKVGEYFAASSSTWVGQMS